MEMFYNKHYITVDASERVTDGWSDGPHAGRDTTGAVCINEAGGYQFRLPVTFTDDTGETRILRTEENPTLYDGEGVPLYKWDGEKVLFRTEEELEADRATIPEPKPSKTVEDRLTALEADAEQTKVDREALNILLGGAE